MMNTNAEPVELKEETIGEVPTKKIYYFGYLSDEAKKAAASNVHEQEEYDFFDWEHHLNDTKTHTKDILTEAGLFVDEVNWSSNYGITLDLTQVSISSDFIKKVLSEEDYALYLELHSISDNNMEEHLFDSHYDDKGFTLEFDTPYDGIDEGDTIHFIMDYADDEEMKDRYKLPLLFIESEENEDSVLSLDELDQLEADLKSLGELLAEDLSIKISAALQPLYKQVYEVIEGIEEYVGSQQYYYDQLEAECTPHDDYLFNKAGTIIIKKDEFINESYEEEYDDIPTEANAY